MLLTIRSGEDSSNGCSAEMLWKERVLGSRGGSCWTRRMYRAPLVGMVMVSGFVYYPARKNIPLHSGNTIRRS